MKEITLKRTAFTSVFTLSIFFFVLFAQAQAQQEADPLAQRQAQNAGGLLRALNLSPEQRAQIRMLREQNKETARTARRRLGQAYRALNEAIHADSVDEREIESRVQEVGTAHVEVERLRAQVELQIRRVITPDQLNALRRMRRQARSERQQRRQENNAPPFSLRKQR
ncbi:MAG: periplasmic heavy metal sensor [Pyrinomonadaceae bacterium]|nr:periplasmic heavy metal sensor [Pyrinomonadaceae bacterium]